MYFCLFHKSKKEHVSELLAFQFQGPPLYLLAVSDKAAHKCDTREQGSRVAQDGFLCEYLLGGSWRA